MSTELIVIFTIVGTLILDLILPRKSKYYVAAFALFGTLASLAPLVIQWASYTSPLYAFENSYVVDKFSIILKGLFILITYLTFLLSINFIESDKYYQGEYYYLLLSSLLGALVVSSSRDLLTIFIGIELASTPMFLLSGWKKGDRKSNEGAIKFFLLGVLSASLILYGFSLLYGLTGKLVFSEISTYLLSNALGDSPVLLLSSILVISGIGFKISVVPFHSWAPDTYEGAPLPVTAYLSVSSKATGFVALIVLLTKVFETSGQSWGVILAIISGATMTLGNLVALQQSNPVRLLAYSSISQAGFIIAPLAAAGITGNYQDGIFASVTYLIIYAFMNLGAFLSIHLFSNFAGSDNFYDWGGVAKHSPLAGVLTTVFFFSLAGIPPLGGWFAKFVVFRSLLSTGEIVGISLAIIGAVNAVIALVYYARISKVIWMDELKNPEQEKTFEFQNPLKVVGALTVLVTFISGVFPGIFSYLGEVSSIFFGN
ncbi:NADH-quinone oxidoreductase subunit N [Acidimicrobiaceae bacterium]|nr:NADH-quinone oxidoreductase subunit N [Acidimicrobiaceae bacterium]